MLDFITKLFGSKHDKDIKLIMPIIEEINEIYEEYESLTDDEIKAKTPEFRKIIADGTLELDEEKATLQKRLREEALNSAETSNIYDRIKEINNETRKIIADILDDILPEAYAVVKQACRRLRDAQHRYEYAGNSDVWNMVPYDVQLIGGVVLHQGRIAEMATGEGKTLVAVMPLYLNSLPGRGAHLVTVNDYLARRDAEWMMPVYDFLGVSVGSIQSNMESSKRKKIYNYDITYGTNNEFGFDYLRDNMVVEQEQMVQREHYFAIVDEVDSVLIDEARTPLIISGPIKQAQDETFTEMKPRIERLVQAQTRLVTKIVADAEELLKSDKKEDIDLAGMYLLRASRGLPKHKRLAKVFQEPSNLKLMKDTELFFLRDKGKRMHEVDDELYYVIEEKSHQIDLREKGLDMLATAQEDKDMFVLPDIATLMSEIDGNTEMADKDKRIAKDKLVVVYAEKSDRLHTVSQLLRAYSLYEKDIEYVIQNGKVMIVDEFTGRVLEGRRYSEGLHQAIEAKENVKVEGDTQTFATITLQNYFRLYKKLAGMTGTAETEAGEFEKIYKLDVVVIPTNREIIREDADDLIYRTKREKYNAIIDEVERLLKENRAVLVGTASVEVSEVLSKMLKRKKITHNVLNAKQHDREAEIVAQAGRNGTVTIATNMAGRGTDIKIDHEVRKAGGLAIIGSERHDARRIDRQLRGRSGRQGDPGSSQFFISLEDNLMRLFGSDRVAGIMQTMKVPEGEAIQHSMITKTVERAQKKVEENNFGIRKRLLEYDDVMNQQREVVYTRRKTALSGERLKGELFDYIEDFAQEWVDDFMLTRDIQELKKEVRSNILCELELKDDDLLAMKKEELVQLLLNSAEEFYTRKEQMLGSEFMAHLEKIAVLQTIDEKWREHLRDMDDLKEGIHLRSYGQKDPLLEYKGEAFKLFIELVRNMNKESVNLAFKFFPKIVEREPSRESRRERDGAALPKMRSAFAPATMRFSHPSENPAFLQGQAQPQGEGDPVAVQTYRRAEKKVGRNDPCPCGSGKKYKHCHGRL